MIFVFKTSVTSNNEIKKLKPLLDKYLENSKWNFDLEDCDNILRVDSPADNSKLIIAIISGCGFNCDELPE